MNTALAFKVGSIVITTGIFKKGSSNGTRFIPHIQIGQEFIQLLTGPVVLVWKEFVPLSRLMGNEIWNERCRAVMVIPTNVAIIFHWIKAHDKIHQLHGRSERRIGMNV
jgi:hypothetical protein